MEKTKKFFLIFLFSLLLILPEVSRAESPIPIYFFYGQDCPYSLKEKEFLINLRKKYPSLEIYSFEVYYNQENKNLLEAMASSYKIKLYSLPITFIGDRAISGYLDKETSEREIENLIKNCLNKNCPDPKEFLLNKKITLFNFLLNLLKKIVFYIVSIFS